MPSVLGIHMGFCPSEVVPSTPLGLDLKGKDQEMKIKFRENEA